MKKIVSFALAAVLALSMCVAVYAVDLDNAGSSSNNVNLNVTIDDSMDQVDNETGEQPKDNKVDPQYSVTLSWSDAFTYTYNITDYDTTNHLYTGTWANGNSTAVTVSNNSNIAINYTPSVAQETTNYNTVSKVSSTDTTTLDAPALGSSDPVTGSFTVSLDDNANGHSGLTTDTAASGLHVGTVTVTIAKAAD